MERKSETQCRVSTCRGNHSLWTFQLNRFSPSGRIEKLAHHSPNHVKSMGNRGSCFDDKSRTGKDPRVIFPPRTYGIHVSPEINVSLANRGPHDFLTCSLSCSFCSVVWILVKGSQNMISSTSRICVPETPTSPSFCTAAELDRVGDAPT